MQVRASRPDTDGNPRPDSTEPPTDEAGSSTRTAAERSKVALSHLSAAWNHYQERRGDQLAGGMAFFGFLAIFPLLLLAVSVTGYVLSGRPKQRADFLKSITSYIPGDTAGSLVNGATAHAGTVGLIGLAGLVLAGLGWVNAVRESLRAIWGLGQVPGNVVTQKIADLISLTGLGFAVIASVGISSGGSALGSTALSLIGIKDNPLAQAGLFVLGLVVAVAADTVLFVYLFARFPRTQVHYRAVLAGALLAAVGFELIKQIGVYYIARVSNHSGQLYGAALAGVFGLLVWMNLVSRFTLFSAAWTVTGARSAFEGDPEGAASPGAEGSPRAAGSPGAAGPPRAAAESG